MDELMEAMVLIEDADEGSHELIEQLEKLESETDEEHIEHFGDIWEAYIAKFGA